MVVILLLQQVFFNIIFLQAIFFYMNRALIGFLLRPCDQILYTTEIFTGYLTINRALIISVKSLLGLLSLFFVT